MDGNHVSDVHLSQVAQVVLDLEAAAVPSRACSSPSPNWLMLGRLVVQLHVAHDVHVSVGIGKVRRHDCSCAHGSARTWSNVGLGVVMVLLGSTAHGKGSAG